MPGLEFLEDELRQLEAARRRRVARVVTARRGCEVEVEGRWLVNFASNDYLGLATDPRLAAAARRAEAELGTGAGASRLISGHSRVTVALEEAVARWVGMESARVFNSGYSANTGLIPVLAQEGDVVFSDELNHASLIDGCRLAKARTVVYRHGDLEHLRDLLDASPGRRRFVVTESVFSMDGAGPPLVELVSIAHRCGAVVIVDDAHALGVCGERGAGLGAAAGADIVVGTLGKAVGAAGAFVAGPRALSELLWNRARTLVFSTGLTVGTQAAALCGVELVSGPEGDDARRQLQVARRRLPVPGDGVIVPVVIGAEEAALQAARSLEEHGFWVPAIRPPTVPVGTSRLRITLSAAHTLEQVDSLAAALR